MQVTAWCLVAKAVRATSIHAGKPREARRIAPRFTSHTPDDPLDKAAYLPRFVPLSSRTPAAKDAAGERFFHGCRQDRGHPAEPRLGAGPFSAGRGRW